MFIDDVKASDTECQRKYNVIVWRQERELMININRLDLYVDTINLSAYTFASVSRAGQ